MDVSLVDLWLPILGGGFLAWMASGVIHMALKYHNLDYKKLPNEDDVLAVVGEGKPGLGLYSLPYCTDPKEMAEEAMQKKFADGPVLFVTVFENGMPNMGKLLSQQFAYFLFSALLVAYALTLVYGTAASGGDVFRLAMTVAFLAFGWGNIPFSIWYGHPWGITARFMLDALIYSAIMAAMFCWLWPSAVS